MSPRSQRNRNLLLWRIALLALAYALPLGGLAFFLHLTGVQGRIAAIEQERLGVRHLRQLALVHHLAVQSIWASSAEHATDLNRALNDLADLERHLAPQGAAPLSRELTAEQLRLAWKQTGETYGDPAEEMEEVVLFLGQVHAHLAQTADVTGLTSSPDLETEFVAEAVAATLPVHLERLLQMHQQLVRLAPRERSMSEHLSAVFLRQLDKELPRLDRNLRSAIEGDRRSAHVAEEFHRVFPPAATGFRDSVLRLREELRADGNSADHWDQVFRRAYLDAEQFWGVALDQLDVLLDGQISHARHQRNEAAVAAGLVLATLLPLTWLYFQRYLRPLVQDLINEVQENADASVKAKNQFLAMMSHEIRTPMNGVIGFAQLLADTPLTAEQRDYVRTILVSGESLLVVINDILDFSKLEAGRTELDPRPVALGPLVEDILELLAAQARAKQIELVYWIDPGVPAGLLADGPRLRQVLLNLVGNAVKFTARGHVEISVEPALAGQLTFHVKDTGIGIPPERRDRLFKAFSQVEASTSRTFGGTGLGLVITRKLIELMGGRIDVDSVPGQGSDFHFTVPLPPAEAPAAPRISAPAEIDAALRDRSILVVDDLEANRRLVERFLRAHGARLTMADSAGAALRASGNFDLAILDYLMPGMHGLALADELRLRQPALPLILLTSVPPETTETKLFAAVLLKPIRHESFIAAVAQVLCPAAPASLPAALAAPRTDFAGTHPLKIAVVDDNPVNLKVIEATLRSYGYAPAVFTDAASAFIRLRAEPFDLVLMDVQMPGMDGLEATRGLRRGIAGESNRQIRIIALTAGAMPEERAACQEAGMDDFLSKPVSRPELISKLMASARERARPD